MHFDHMLSSPYYILAASIPQCFQEHREASERRASLNSPASARVVWYDAARAVAKDDTLTIAVAIAFGIEQYMHDALHCAQRSHVLNCAKALPQEIAAVTTPGLPMDYHVGKIHAIRSFRPKRVARDMLQRFANEMRPRKDSDSQSLLVR
jgi:hypothetical protein